MMEQGSLLRPLKADPSELGLGWCLLDSSTNEEDGDIDAADLSYPTNMS